MTGVLDSLGGIDVDILSIGMASATAAVTASEAGTYAHYITKAVPGAGGHLTLPQVVWSGTVSNDSASTGNLVVSLGTVSYSLAPGAEASFETDGTANGLIKRDDLGGNSVVLPSLNLGTVKSAIRSISLSDGNQVASASAVTKRNIIRLTGASGTGGAGNTLTLPALIWWGLIGSEATNVSTITIAVGTGTITLDPGEVLAVQLDGTANGIAAAVPGPGAPGLGWRTVTVADSPVALTAGSHIDFDTTGGAITATLDLTPPKFAEVYVRNSANTFATHALTIQRNGQTIMAIAEDMTVNTGDADFSLWFNGSTWQFPGAQL